MSKHFNQRQWTPVLTAMTVALASIPFPLSAAPNISLPVRRSTSSQFNRPDRIHLAQQGTCQRLKQSAGIYDSRIQPQTKLRDLNQGETVTLNEIPPNGYEFVEVTYNHQGGVIAGYVNKAFLTACQIVNPPIQRNSCRALKEPTGIYDSRVPPRVKLRNLNRGKPLRSMRSS